MSLLVMVTVRKEYKYRDTGIIDLSNLFINSIQQPFPSLPNEAPPIGKIHPFSKMA